EFKTRHIPGLQNTTADALNRLEMSRDYYLKQEVFNQALIDLGFQVVVDDFGNRMNKRLNNINQDSERQCGGNANCTQMEGINMVRDVEKHVEEESSSMTSGPSSGARGDYDKQSIEETTSRSVGSTLGDKHAEGEQLFRKIASYVGLEEHTVMNIINSLSPETWRKRRSGMHLFSNYIKEKQVPMEQIVSKNADVLLSNALTWRELQGGNHMLEDLRKKKTRVGMVLSMFSSQNNVSQSPIIATLSKRLELDREQKSKYAVVLNLQMLLDYRVVEKSIRRTFLHTHRRKFGQLAFMIGCLFITK
ncbi:MAG: hypothetical protein EZS28_013747, partial [Streblomastix strix]